jgi:hypothetical protein
MNCIRARPFLPAAISKPFPTRQELIPSTALASLSIDDNRSMWIPKGSEILRLYAYLRPSPGTIPGCDSTYPVSSCTVAISYKSRRAGPIFGHLNP